MSDPVCDTDMEGVLSRVRRLVRDSGDAVTGRAETFVLTEAYRVDTETAAAPAAADERDRPDDAEHAGRLSIKAVPEAAEADLIGTLVAREVDRVLDPAAPAASALHAGVEREPDPSALLGRITRAVGPSGSEGDGNTLPMPQSRPGLPDPHSAEVLAHIPPDALRALVAETVRSELQGALGERITRNLRKLVRREIHRALLSREID
jgi:hypothetical protein